MSLTPRQIEELGQHVRDLDTAMTLLLSEMAATAEWYANRRSEVQDQLDALISPQAFQGFRSQVINARAALRAAVDTWRGVGSEAEPEPEA